MIILSFDNTGFNNTKSLQSRVRSWPQSRVMTQSSQFLTYVCIYIYIYTQIDRQICMYIYIYREIERERYMYICVYIYIYIYMYVCVYMYIHNISLHTYICIYIERERDTYLFYYNVVSHGTGQNSIAEGGEDRQNVFMYVCIDGIYVCIYLGIDV